MQSSLKEIPDKPRLFKSKYGFILVVGLKHPPNSMKQDLVAIVPSNMFSSLRHLVLAALRAYRSIREGVNIANAFSYELGICLIGSREISKVIKAMRGGGGRGYALVSVCEDPLECRSLLMSILMKGARLGKVEALYKPRKLPICSGNEDVLAMEEGALIELDR